MNDPRLWLTGGCVITEQGVVDRDVAVDGETIAAIQPHASAGARTLSVAGQFVAPGLIDLHLWGDARQLAREVVATGTTSFLRAIGPCQPEELVRELTAFDDAATVDGARCLGAHLEGPFINPQMAGALPKRWMRPAVARELAQLAAWASRIKLMTLAPELRGAAELIRWCRRQGIAVSLGHTNADADTARRAIDAGATAVTHLFNQMRPFHHRDPGLLGAALTDSRVAAMVIADGAHISPTAVDIAVRCKGPAGVVLGTDSIPHEHAGRRFDARRGAYVTVDGGVLAGSGLTLIDAVRHAVEFARIPVADAVRMASGNPARLLGQAHRLGAIDESRQADLVVFDDGFRVQLTMVSGHIVYQRGVRRTRQRAGVMRKRG